ncbi:MAG: class I SAM-dependent methyltransferase [Phycisphaerae bacterium]
MSFSKRTYLTAEDMDAPTADAALLARALRFLRRVNRWLGWNRAVWQQLADDGVVAEVAEGAAAGRGEWRVLDVAAGSADLAVYLQRKLAGHGHRITATAVDFHPVTVELAKHWVDTQRDAVVQFVQADALRLPFADGSFDAVVCSTFLHHLPDDASAIRLLREMDRVCRGRLVLADLVRSRRAYGYVTLMGLFAGPMVFHDGRVSVRQAFTTAEVQRLRDEAGLGYLKVRKSRTHRFILAGRRRK